jgi:hypothetical protein
MPVPALASSTVAVDWMVRRLAERHASQRRQLRDRMRKSAAEWLLQGSGGAGDGISYPAGRDTGAKRAFERPRKLACHANSNPGR